MLKDDRRNHTQKKTPFLRQLFNEIARSAPEGAAIAGLTFLAMTGDMNTQTNLADIEPDRITHNLHDDSALSLNQSAPPEDVKITFADLPDEIAVPPTFLADDMRGKQDDLPVMSYFPQDNAKEQDNARANVMPNVIISQCEQLPHRCTLALSGEYALRFASLEDFTVARDHITNTLRSEFMDLTIPESVNGALVAASVLTDYSYDYWVGKAYAESKFDDNAFNKSTKARGLFQFLPDSAMETLYYMGQSGKYDFVPETAQVERKTVRNKDGERVFVFQAAKGVDRAKLLETVLNDPLKSAFLAAEYNERYLKSLTLPPGMEATSLTAYIVHWQGRAGAQKLYNAYGKDPDQTAWKVFARSERATIVRNHKSLFFTENGTARTLKQMLDHLAQDRGIGEVPLKNLDDLPLPDTKIIALSALEKGTAIHAFAPVAAGVTIEQARLGEIYSPLSLSILAHNAVRNIKPAAPPVKGTTGL